MKSYLDLGRKILEQGASTSNRTGVKTLSLFGESIKIDLQKGFPILTTKKVNYTKPILELLWFIRGPEDGLNMNTKWLHENGVKFWDTWADKNGNLGPVYGSMLRGVFSDGTVTKDQLTELMSNLRLNPYSRRHVVSLWHPGYLPNESTKPSINPSLGKGALAPCFWSYTVNIEPYQDTNKVNLHINARSSDVPVGLPYNIIQFATLTHMLANRLKYLVGSLYITITNAHIYEDQVDLFKEQLEREPEPLPMLVIKRSPESIYDFNIQDFELIGYKHHLPIKYPVAE